MMIKVGTYLMFFSQREKNSPIEPNFLITIETDEKTKIRLF